MSVPGKEIPDTGDNAIGNSDDEDDRVGNQRRKKKRSYGGFAGKFRRAKQVLLCSFPRNRRRRWISTRDNGVSGNPRCTFCIGRPRTLESPAESDTSDPNDPAFTHETLTALLEKNDFYSKECNPHLDFDELPPYNRAG